jgi:hypothetical protein
MLECAVKMKPENVTAALGSSYSVSIVVSDMYDTTRVYTIGEDITKPEVIGNKTEVAKIRRIGTVATPDGNHLAKVDVYVYR